MQQVIYQAKDARDMQISPDGNFLALCKYGQSGLTLIDMQTGVERNIAAAKKQFGPMCFSPNSQQIVQSNVVTNKTHAVFYLNFYDVKNGKVRCLTIPELGLKGIFVKKLVWRAETNQIIGLGEHCFVIDTNSGKVVREFDLTSELLRDVEISSDGKMIAGINDKNADSVYAFRAPSDADFKTIENRGVRLWNARNGKFLRSLDQKYQSQYAIAFSKSGNIVASDATEGAIQLWETSGGRKLRNLKPPKNSSFYLWPYKGGIQFSPTENLLAVVGYPATVYLYDAGTGKIQRTLKSNGQNEIDTLCFSSDGKILFTLRTDGTITRWRIR